MIRLILPACLCLVACTTPTGYFRGVPPTRAQVDGYIFDIRVRRELAEARRVGAQYAPRAAPFFGPAQVAIEQVSGCRVTRIGGDQVLITAILDCAAIRNALPLSSAYDCTTAKGMVTCTRTNTGDDPQYLVENPSK